MRKAASRVVARGKTQRRDREVLFYPDLRRLLPSPRTFTLRDRILRIRAAALFLPVLYAVIDPTYAVEAIPGEYSVRPKFMGVSRRRRPSRRYGIASTSFTVLSPSLSLFLSV